MHDLWITLKTVFKGIVLLLACFGVAVIALVVFAVSAFLYGGEKEPALPQEFVLELNLDEQIPESPVADIFSLLAEDVPLYNFTEAVNALNKAASDNRVKALSAKINMSFLGPAQAEELRLAVKEFMAQNKPSLVYSETVGADGYGTSEYYLASAFKEIWVQPTGNVNFVGVVAETPFFKPVLQKLGVNFEVYSRYEYKGAAESFTADNMSEPVKQNMQTITTGMYETIASEVANDRKLSLEEVKRLIDVSPLSAREAKRSGLIDRLAYRNEVGERFKDLPKVSLGEYINALKTEREADESNNKIAVLYIDGMIVSGMDGYNPSLLGDAFADADEVVDLLTEISENEKVKALVVRINSEGGSYTASDAIRNAVEVLKQQKKIPVVASLADTAASGAYFAAIAADKIVTDNLSLTGSIGVFGGKPVVTELWKKIGVNWNYITNGANAAMMSINEPFSPQQVKNFEASLDEIYTDFTARVAQARNLTGEQVDKLARGRVWLGKDAVANGLADKTGGVSDAVKLAASLAKIDNYALLSYPEEKTRMDMIVDFLQGKLALSPASFLSFVSRKISLVDNTNVSSQALTVNLK